MTCFNDNRSWLPLFVEVLLTTADWLDSISLSKVMKHFPSLRLQVHSTGTTKESVLQSLHLMKESSYDNNLNIVLNGILSKCIKRRIRVEYTASVASEATAEYGKFNTLVFKFLKINRSLKS